MLDQKSYFFIKKKIQIKIQNLSTKMTINHEIKRDKLNLNHKKYD